MRQIGYFAQEARTSGKRARTRAALLDAAVAVIANKGIEGASANEIAREAGIANGTFYLHFRDKEELVTEAAIAVAVRIARELDDSMSHLDNAIDRIVFGTRNFLQIVVEDHDLGRAVLNAFRDLRNSEVRVQEYLRADIKRGVDQGVFAGPADDFLVASVGVVVTTALAALLQGELGEEAGARAAELQLKMLGVEPDKAKRAAWQQLDPA